MSEAEMEERAPAEVEVPVPFLRPATPDDRDACLELLRRAFGPENAPDERRWEWTFLRNPSGAGMRYVVAETDDGRVVGQYAALPSRMQLRGNELIGVISLDTALDEEYRGQGLMSSMIVEFFDPKGDPDVSVLVYGFVNAVSLSMFTKRLPAAELRPTPLLIRPVAGLASVAAGWRPWAAPLGAAGELALRGLGAANRGLARLGPGRRERRVEPLDGFGPWADRLWEELAPVLGTAVIRDAAYLNWRFVDAPYSYRRHALVGPDGPEGFAVVGSLQRRGLELDMLMELMVRPDDAAGARLLLDRVLREATERRVAAIATVATPRHPHMARLRQAGFVNAPEDLTGAFHFTCWGFGPAVVPNYVYHVDDWHLSGADLDFA